MKGRWKVTSNRVGDNSIFGVYRLRDTTEVDHSGNREMYGDYMDSRTEAQEIADRLNAAEALNGSNIRD